MRKGPKTEPWSGFLLLFVFFFVWKISGWGGKKFFIPVWRGTKAFFHDCHAPTMIVIPLIA